MITLHQARMIHELRHLIHGDEFAGRVSDIDIFYLQMAEIKVDRAGVDLTIDETIYEQERLVRLWETWRIPDESETWNMGHRRTAIEGG